jgi:hypothetical protein
LQRRFRTAPADSSGTGGIGLIALKNLQNPRICHVLMYWPMASAPCYTADRVFSRPLQAGPWAQPAFCVMERALKHKFTVGETVYFTASNVARPAASGTYEVIRLLPTDGDDCQYRIKNSTEAFERVAKESQLDIS